MVSLRLRLLVPDQARKPGDVVLSFDNLDGYPTDAYVKSRPYFSALIGRYDNRLATNNGANSRPGGRRGFDKRAWKWRSSG